MLSWCKTRRAAVLFGVGGVLVVALVVCRIVPATGGVKKAAKPLSIPHPAQAPAPAVPPPVSAYTPAPPPAAAPVPPTPYSPPATPPVADFTKKSIDQLLNDLDVVRGQKGELENQEKKLITVLRQKLADQEQRLRKHGLAPTDTPACCSAISNFRWSLPSVSH